MIEVLVALTIGGFVVLAANQTFGAAVDAAARLAEARERHEVEMRARRLLTTTFASLDVATPGVVGFRGTPTTVAFSTQDRAIELRLADGWLSLRHETMAVSGQRSAARGQRSAARGPARLLPADRVTFDYLLHAGADEAWVREWQSPVSAPLAVRVRLVRPGGGVDTLLFAIGSRG